MKIGFFYKDFLSGGGLPKDYQRMVHEVASLGNEVFVYTYEGPDSIADANYTIRSFPGSKRPSFLLPASLSMILKNNPDKLDIIEVVGGFFPENMTVCKLLSSSGLPYVYAPLGQLAPNILSKNALAKKMFINLFLKKALSGARSIHCCSGFDRKNTLKLIQKPTFISTLGTFTEEIPKTIRSDYFERNTPHFEGRTIILYFGRVDYHNKGLDVIVDALSLMGESRNKVGLVIIGPTKEKDLDLLKKQIKQTSVGDCVTILPPVYGDEKYSALASSDFYLLPSRKDNIPRAVREALAVNCPVLVSEETGTSDIVIKYGGGFMVKTDPSDLAAILLNVLNHKDQWPLLREAAGNTAREGFSWSSQARLLHEGLRKALDEFQ